MVTTRSLSGMKDESALRSVVLPVPVPPLMSTFSLARTTAPMKPMAAGVALPMATRSLARMPAVPKRRMERMGPSMASGGMIALTRDPSGRRASTIGDVSSTRRPTRDTIRLMTRIR